MHPKFGNLRQNGNVRLEQCELNYLYNKITMYAMNRGTHLSEIIHNTSRAEQGLWILSPLSDRVVTKVISTQQARMREE